MKYCANATVQHFGSCKKFNHIITSSCQPKSKDKASSLAVCFALASLAVHTSRKNPFPLLPMMQGFHHSGPAPAHASTNFLYLITNPERNNQISSAAIRSGSASASFLLLACRLRTFPSGSDGEFASNHRSCPIRAAQEALSKKIT